MIYQVGRVVGTVGVGLGCYMDSNVALAGGRVQGDGPEVGRWVLEAVHDQSQVFVRDTYFYGCECGNISMTTELANRDKGVS
jgi:hypothetical protein